MEDDSTEGAEDMRTEGATVGLHDGSIDGSTDGAVDGTIEGTMDGLHDGEVEGFKLDGLYDTNCGDSVVGISVGVIELGFTVG